MGRVGVVYTGKLGDIVGTLPKSYALHKAGHRVAHYVSTTWAEFLEKAVPHVEVRIVEGNAPDSYPRAHDLARVECEKVFDRQIFPALIWDYRGSGQTWCDYYFRDVPEWKTLTGRFLFKDDGFKWKDDTLIVSMHGVSSPLAVNWGWVNSVIEKLKALGVIKTVIYTCAPWENCPLKGVEIDHSPTWKLPGMIAAARMAFMRNSGPAWMAYSIGTPTLHLPDSAFPMTDTAGLMCKDGLLCHAPNMIPLPHASDDATTNAAIQQVLDVPRI
jgi:hypothetical protein